VAEEAADEVGVGGADQFGERVGLDGAGDLPAPVARAAAFLEGRGLLLLAGRDVELVGQVGDELREVGAVALGRVGAEMPLVGQVRLKRGDDGQGAHGDIHSVGSLLRSGRGAA